MWYHHLAEGWSPWWRRRRRGRLADGAGRICVAPEGCRDRSRGGGWLRSAAAVPVAAATRSSSRRQRNAEERHTERPFFVRRADHAVASSSRNVSYPTQHLECIHDYVLPRNYGTSRKCAWKLIELGPLFGIPVAEWSCTGVWLSWPSVCRWFWWPRERKLICGTRMTSLLMRFLYGQSAVPKSEHPAALRRADT